MEQKETKIEIYLAEITLNEGYPAEKMIVIENEDSYLFINKDLYSISFDKPFDKGLEDVKITKLDNICHLFYKL